MPVSKIKDELNKIINDIIGPLMKANGFKKSAQHFYKELNGFGLCFNVQSDKYNTSNEVGFTFNTGLFPAAIYQSVNGWQPPLFPKEYDCGIRLRIGEMFGKNDFWYMITPETDIGMLHKTIIDHVNQYILPHLNRFTCYSDITKYYKEYIGQAMPFENLIYSGYLVLSGDEDKGKKVLMNYYKNTSNSDYKIKIEQFANKLGIKLF